MKILGVSGSSSQAILYSVGHFPSNVMAGLSLTVKVQTLQRGRSRLQAHRRYSSPLSWEWDAAPAEACCQQGRLVKVGFRRQDYVGTRDVEFLVRFYESA